MGLCLWSVYVWWLHDPVIIRKCKHTYTFVCLSLCIYVYSFLCVCLRVYIDICISMAMGAKQLMRHVGENLFVIAVVVMERSALVCSVKWVFLCTVGNASDNGRAWRKKQYTEQVRRGNLRQASLFRSNNGTSGMMWLVNVQSRDWGGRQITTGFSLDQTSQVIEEKSRLRTVTLCNSVMKSAAHV